MKQPLVIENARDLLRAYPVVFCDVWGVVHNGVREYAGAGDALERYRAGGGHVVLLSNAPTPSPSVARVLDEKGVPIFIEKRKFEQEENEIVLIVDKKPAKAGIDPLNKLIDRRPRDNAITVEKAS